MPTPLIHLRDLEFSYRDQGSDSSAFQLSIADLRIAEGTRTALIGASGSGKTTLANLVSGIYSPDAGSVMVNGVRVDELAEAARRDFRIQHIGFIFQEFELLDYLPARENILLPFSVNHSLTMGADAESKLSNLAQSVGLTDKLKKYPSELSQGERQRLAICRALIADPKLIIADEPTGNLDPTTSQQVLDLLFDEVKQRELTFLMITHDHSVLERFDQVINLHDLVSPLTQTSAE